MSINLIISETTLSDIQDDIKTRNSELESLQKQINDVELLIESKILKNITEVKEELKKGDEYKYVQIDPFFRKNNFAICYFRWLFFSPNRVIQKSYLVTFYCLFQRYWD